MSGDSKAPRVHHEHHEGGCTHDHGHEDQQHGHNHEHSKDNQEHPGYHRHQPHYHGDRLCTGHHHHVSQPHLFWETQPVQSNSKPQSIGSILPPSPPRATPYALPPGFSWCEVSLSEDISELHDLLSGHYVEDADGLFRFDYSAEFLQWALGSKNSNADWFIGVRAGQKLVAFISGVPGKVILGGAQPVQVAEVNFLCIHRKLRSKRLAPVLIKELTRRVNMRGIWQAVYTAGTELPGLVSQATYFHRALNMKKLVDVGFMGIPGGSTLARQSRLLKLPSGTGGFKPLERSHCKQVHGLLAAKLASCSFRPVFSVEEVTHLLLPRSGVVSSYVKESNGKVTDFYSFYCLPSSCLKETDPEKQKLKVAYMFYSAGAMTQQALITEALVSAHTEGFDVFNALTCAASEELLRSLKFGRGDGKLHFYAYNWSMGVVGPEDVGLIMV